jgi:hypothetical protein
MNRWRPRTGNSRDRSAAAWPWVDQKLSRQTQFTHGVRVDRQLASRKSACRDPQMGFREFAGALGTESVVAVCICATTRFSPFSVHRGATILGEWSPTRKLSQRFVVHPLTLEGDLTQLSAHRKLSRKDFLLSQPSLCRSPRSIFRIRNCVAEWHSCLRLRMRTRGNVRTMGKIQDQISATGVCAVLR